MHIWYLFLIENSHFVIYWRVIIIEFSGDDDGIDSDSGSYFYGISLTDSFGAMTDLLLASLWLSPSSGLSEVMVTNTESCDQSFCAKFSTTTFMSAGSANSNLYYPRYLHAMMAPFTINAQILKNFACDDHFLVLSRQPMGSTFGYRVREDTISFAWDCKHKYIFAETSETVRGEVRDKTSLLN